MAWFSVFSSTSSHLSGVYGSVVVGGEIRAAGDDATVTVGAGPAWNLDSIPRDLQSVWGANTSDIWAVGMGGMLRHYDGATWTPFVSHTGKTFRSVWGLNSTDVWAVGNSVPGENAAAIHWDGTSWTDVSQFGLGNGLNLRSIWGIATDDIWAVGEAGAVLNHLTGGFWVDEPNPIPAQMFGVFGFASNDVWSVGAAGTIVHWDGATWNTVSSPTSEDLFSVWGIATDDVWAVGTNGMALHWDGVSWTQSSMFSFNSLYSVFGFATDDVWTVDSNGDSYHWDGANWNFFPTAFNIPLYSVWEASANDVWTVGTNGIRQHWDGASWTVSVQTDLPKFTDIWVADSGSAVPVEAWAVGFEGVAYHFVSGAWAATNTETLNDLQSINGLSPTEVWSVGDQKVLRWSGSSWMSMSLNIPFSGAYSAIWTSSPTDGWASGPSGTLLRLSGSWDYYPLSGVWNAISGLTSDDVWMVGDGGTATHWDGASWTPSTTPTSANLYGVYYANDGVWACGASGTIIEFNGSSWINQTASSSVTASLRDIWSNTQGEVIFRIAVGDKGTIIKNTGSLTPWVAINVGLTHEDLYTFFRSSTPSFSQWIGGTNGVMIHSTTGSFVLHNLDGDISGGAALIGTIRSMRGLNSNNLFAVGDGVGYHWNGSAWGFSLSVISDHFTGVWATGSDVWAVGQGITGDSDGYFPSLFHFDSFTWSRVDHEVPVPYRLNTVFGNDSSTIWALGDGGAMMRINGSLLTDITFSKSPTLNNITDIWGPATDDAWMVTDSGDVFRWDGFSWNSFASAFAPFNGVHGSATDDVWIAQVGGGTWHWDGSSFAASDSSTVAGGEDLHDIFVPFSGSVWAVGSGGTVIHWAHVTSSSLDATGFPSLQVTSFTDDGFSGIFQGNWVSSDPSVATIDSFGNVTFLGPGTVTFTYDLEGVFSSYTYTLGTTDTGPSLILTTGARRKLTERGIRWANVPDGRADLVVHRSQRVWHVSAPMLVLDRPAFIDRGEAARGTATGPRNGHDQGGGGGSGNGSGGAFDGGGGSGYSGAIKFRFRDYRRFAVPANVLPDFVYHAPPAGHILDSNAEALWRFDEQLDTDNPVDIANAHFVEAFGDPVVDIGKVGNARRIDSTHYLQGIGNSAFGLALSGNFTVEQWVNPDHAPASSELFIYNGLNFSADPNHTILAETQYSITNFPSGDEGQIIFHQWHTPTSVTEMMSSGSIVSGSWSHYALVRETQGHDNLYTFSIYINGQLDSTFPNISGVNFNVSGSGHFIGLGNYIGNTGFGLISSVGNPFYGKMDDSRISKVARSPSEILDSYNRGFGT